MAQVESLLKRREKAMARKENWRALLDKTYKYFLPNRNPFERASPGSNLNRDVYDLTGVLGLNKFVNRMINALVPSDQNWLTLVPGREIPDDERDNAARTLQNITDTFFFYLRQSNFDLIIHEAFTDMAISTGLLQVNEGDDDNPLIFSSAPADHIGFEEGPHGEISGFFRDFFDLPLEHIQTLWPKAELPTELTKRNSPVEVDVYEISYFDYQEKKYRYYVIEKSTSQIIYELEDESGPWIAFRWRKLSSETRGRGPALDALPSVATINKAMEDELTSAALKANPIYMGYDDGVFNPYTFRLEPNTILPVNRTGTEGWPLQPLPQAGDISFSALVVNDLRAQINDLMLAAPLQPYDPNASPVTATEVIVRQQELRENAGASFARLQRELFDPLVKRILYILRKKGLIEPFKLDGKEVAIKYATPLSVSKTQADVQRFTQFYQLLQSIFGEASISLIEGAKLPRYLAENLDAELDLVKDETTILRLLEQAQQQVQQQEVMNG